MNSYPPEIDLRKHLAEWMRYNGLPESGDLFERMIATWNDDPEYWASTAGWSSIYNACQEQSA